MEQVVLNPDQLAKVLSIPVKESTRLISNLTNQELEQLRITYLQNNQITSQKDHRVSVNCTLALLFEQYMVILMLFGILMILPSLILNVGLCYTQFCSIKILLSRSPASSNIYLLTDGFVLLFLLTLVVFLNEAYGKALKNITPDIANHNSLISDYAINLQVDIANLIQGSQQDIGQWIVRYLQKSIQSKMQQNNIDICDFEIIQILIPYDLTIIQVQLKQLQSTISAIQSQPENIQLHKKYLEILQIIRQKQLINVLKRSKSQNHVLLFFKSPQMQTQFLQLFEDSYNLNSLHGLVKWQTKPPHAFLMGACFQSIALSLVNCCCKTQNSQEISMIVTKTDEPQNMLMYNRKERFEWVYNLLGAYLVNGIAILLIYLQTTRLSNLNIYSDFFSMPLIILLTNFLVFKILTLTSTLESCNSISNDLILITRMAYVSTMNTLFIPLIMNIYFFVKTDDSNYISGQNGLKSQIFNLALIKMILPNLMVIIGRGFHQLKIRFPCYCLIRKLCSTDNDLKRYFGIAELDINHMYIYTIKTTFFVAFYVWLEPVILIFGFIGILTRYLLITYFYNSKIQMPKIHSSTKLFEHVINISEYVLLLYGVGSLILMKVSNFQRNTTDYLIPVISLILFLVTCVPLRLRHQFIRKQKIQKDQIKRVSTTQKVLNYSREYYMTKLTSTHTIRIQKQQFIQGI